MATPVTPEAATRFLGNRQRTLFVVGSGVSRPAPASAPSAQQILAASLDTLLDATFDPSGDQDLKRRIRARCLPDDPRDALLPEALYGAIADVYETLDHIALWSALNSTKFLPACGRPNAGHLVLVCLAAQNASPIVTTNFDPFLERAAQILGLTARVIVPDPNGSLRSIGTMEADVTIWKVHGSASEWRTVRSRASDLTQATRIVQGTDFGDVEAVLFVGYSGTDFDVFPWIAERYTGPSRKTLWIARDPESTRVTALKEADFCAANFEVLARRFVALGHPNLQISQLEEEISKLPPIDAEQSSALSDYAERRARAGIEEVINRSPERARSAVASALNTLGAHSLLLEVTKDVGSFHALPRPIEADIRLFRAGSLSSQDRFEQAALEAQQALELSRSEMHADRVNRSKIALHYARFSSSFLRLPGRPRLGRLIKSPAGIRLVFDRILRAAQFLVLTLRLTRPGKRAIRSMRQNDAATTGPVYRLACDYIEQTIRFLAFVESAVPPVRRFSLRNRIWGRIATRARSCGYTWGVVNVSKYQSRAVTESIWSALLATAIYPDDIPKAIAHLDAGRARLRQGNISEAAQQFDLAEKAARRADCASLLWKIAFARNGERFGGLSVKTTEMLLDQIESQSVRAERVELAKSATQRSG